MYNRAFIAHHAVELVEGVVDKEDSLLGGEGRYGHIYMVKCYI